MRIQGIGAVGSYRNTYTVPVNNTKNNSVVTRNNSGYMNTVPISFKWGFDNNKMIRFWQDAYLLYDKDQKDIDAYVNNSLIVDRDKGRNFLMARISEIRKQIADSEAVISRYYPLMLGRLRNGDWIKSELQADYIDQISAFKKGHKAKVPSAIVLTECNDDGVTEIGNWLYFEQDDIEVMKTECHPDDIILLDLIKEEQKISKENYEKTGKSTAYIITNTDLVRRLDDYKFTDKNFLDNLASVAQNSYPNFHMTLILNTNRTYDDFKKISNFYQVANYAYRIQSTPATYEEITAYQKAKAEIYHIERVRTHIMALRDAERMRLEADADSNDWWPNV